VHEDWEEFLAINDELKVVTGVEVFDDWEETVNESEDITVAGFGLVAAEFEEVIVVVAVA